MQPDIGGMQDWLNLGLCLCRADGQRRCVIVVLGHWPRQAESVFDQRLLEYRSPVVVVAPCEAAAVDLGSSDSDHRQQHEGYLVVAASLCSSDRRTSQGGVEPEEEARSVPSELHIESILLDRDLVEFGKIGRVSR